MSEKIKVKTNKVGRSIRVTIPASIRAGLGIAAGTVLNVSRVGKKIVFELPYEGVNNGNISIKN